MTRFQSAIAAVLAAQMVALSAHADPGTAFTYQGRLTDGDVPAAGKHDLQFRLFDADVAARSHALRSRMVRCGPGRGGQVG